MAENRPLHIIKGAILLEKRGKALYESVVEKTKIAGVRDLFNLLIKEEKKHIELLNAQLSRVVKGKNIDASGLEQDDFLAADKVISDDIASNVAGAGYESAVISAALEVEKNAVQYYSKNASTAKSREVKRLFQWLARWEKSHMHMLAKIDDDIKEQIWFDHQFWKF